jgi:mono/diheme cytochrome c family protein
LALIVALALAGTASAQNRNSQRPRAPELPASGHQTEAVDLNEGKSAAELFKAGCAVCHQSAAGLAKGRRDAELAGFLRQHYTSSAQHAAALAGFLSSSGGRGGPAQAATPARLNPNAPVERPPAPVGREEAARPPEREPAAKRRPAEKPPVARVQAPPAPAAPPPAATEAAAHAGEAPAPNAPPAPPVEEKPVGPEIPL